MTSGPSFRLVARRVAATAIDGLLGGGLAVVFAVTPVGDFFARRAVVMLQIDNPASVWKGTIPLALGAFGELSYSLPFALLLVVGAEALAGRSPGKWMLGIRIASPDGDSCIMPRALALRATVKTVAFWGCVVGLIAGSWLVALCGVIAGCVVMASVLMYRPLHERVSHTRIVLSNSAVEQEGGQGPAAALARRPG